MLAKIFVSYAREDEALLKKLKGHLKPLQRQRLIDLWYDRDISAGSDWEHEIDEHLNSADVVLLLVSPNFMNSDYCYGIEVLLAMKRHSNGEARVIPIILRPTLWWETPLHKLQALPKDAKAVTTWRNRDAAFLDIAQGIREAIDELQIMRTVSLPVFKQSQSIANQIVHRDNLQRESTTQVRELHLPIPKQVSRPGRILVVDDLENWRTQLAEALRESGFYVDTADSTEKALEQLGKAAYHLLMTDIRQVDTDPKNRGGFVILRELRKRGLDQVTKAIVLSASSTVTNVREAFEVHKVVDFLSKEKFSRKAFLEAIRSAFDQEMDINLALEIYWPEGSGLEQAVLNLEIDGISAKQGTELQIQLVDELEDLLCRLFYRAKSIVVQPLISNFQGKEILRVQPFYAYGRSGHEVIIRLGDFRKVEKEYHNFKRYVQPFLGGGTSTMLLNISRTLHFGGIMYSLLGNINDQLMDFGTFYHHADVSQITDLLDQLFYDTCGVWYANRKPLAPLDLAADYQRLFEYTPERSMQAVSEQLISVQGEQKLTFKSLKDSRVFTNPWLAMNRLVYPTHVCITHGNLNHHNILVDKAKHAWLINFQETGESHILRDVAMLDSIVRFQLLASEEATLEERLHMEEKLLSIGRFSQIEQLATNFSTHNKALAKAYTIVVHLRALARKLVEQNPNDDISEYYIALFYNAMNILQSSSASSRQREHALLSASLLADRLGLNW